MLTFFEETVYIAGVHALGVDVPYADPEFDIITMAQIFGRLNDYDQMNIDLATKYENGLRAVKERT